MAQALDVAEGTVFRIKRRFADVNNQELHTRESKVMLLSSDSVTLIEKRICPLG